MGPHKLKHGSVLEVGRYLVGRSESCDLCIPDDSVSAVHAVLEIFTNKAIIYDMNSTNGTYVNGEKIIKKDIPLNSFFSIGRIDIKFSSYSENEALPPVLDSLEPLKGQASIKSDNLKYDSKKSLPQVPKDIEKNPFPRIIYPLESDPKAEFSEYIFEDKNEIYPIFKYDLSKSAVEVIILHNDNIFSIDYLPDVKGQYFIAGIPNSKNSIEFPYLGKNERLEFIHIGSSLITVNSLPGFDLFVVSNRNEKTTSGVGSVELEKNDIVRLSKDSLQIFVRNVSAPPKVATAPILKRDPDFQKYFFTFLFLIAFLGISLNLIEIPEDEKKDELAPERLATILYKQPLTVSKNKSVEKTENAPKEVAQKAPPKPAISKEVPSEPQKDNAKPDILEAKPNPSNKDPGKKTAPEKVIVKKGNPSPNKSIKTSPSPSSSSSKSNALTKKSTSTSPVKSLGHVEVYKSVDFKSSLNSLVAKGGALSGIQSTGAGVSSGDLAGVGSSVGSGTGNIKTSSISTNQGSLLGSTSGAISDTRGAEGLSAKKSVYTAGIPSETVVLGGMDPDVIRRILLDHLPQFRYCYQKELEKTGSEVSGVVKLSFTIGASGHVSQAGVEGSSSLPVDVKKCVVGVLRGISFPEPNGGGVVEVKQPMNFYPKKI
jgi:pSer/pThr/pTyr-binding forkhead associated (FHA) protein/outer membrane biosynthesis protein TonB